MKPFFELLKITETLVVEMFYYIQIHPGLFESGSQKKANTSSTIAGLANQP